MIDIGFSLTQSSPWLQVFMVLAFALPGAMVSGALLIRFADWVASVLGEEPVSDVE